MLKTHVYICEIESTFTAALHRIEVGGTVDDDVRCCARLREKNRAKIARLLRESYLPVLPRCKLQSKYFYDDEGIHEN